MKKRPLPQTTPRVALDYAEIGGDTDKHEQTTSSSLEVTVGGTAPDGTPLAKTIQVSTNVENILEPTIDVLFNTGYIGIARVFIAREINS